MENIVSGIVRMLSDGYWIYWGDHLRIYKCLIITVLYTRNQYTILCQLIENKEILQRTILFLFEV